MLKIRCYCPHCYDKLSNYDRKNTWSTTKVESEGELMTKEDKGEYWYFRCKNEFCGKPWSVKRSKPIEPDHHLIERIEK